MNAADRILGEAAHQWGYTNFTPEGFYKLAHKFGRDKALEEWPAGEKLLARSNYWSERYATDVLKGPFPEAEKHWYKDPEWVTMYSTKALKRRWPEAEKATIIPLYLGQEDWLAARPWVDEEYDKIWALDYIKAFPEAKVDWAINGLIDWTDL